MDKEERERYILNLENRFPVNEWVIDNIHLWPLIKVKLSLAANVNENKKHVKKSGSVFFLLELIKSFIYYISLQIKRKKNISEIYCSAPHFRYKEGNVYRHRYFNGLISNLNSKKDFLVIEYNTNSKSYRQNIEHHDQTIFLSKLMPLFLVARELKWLFFEEKKRNFLKFDEFCKEITENLDLHSFSLKSILRQYLLITTIKSFYDRLLLKYNVKKVYILCYYVSEMYAMNLATNELNIDSYDIQHGGQGHMHKAYANFNSVPKSGYQLMPKIFWCWDQGSADSINIWVKRQDYHMVQVLGNPWVEYCLKKYKNIFLTNKKIILYTLINTRKKEFLDSFIKDAINRTSNDYVWWIRLHPLELNRIDEFKDYLLNNNLNEKVEVVKAIKLPLPVILNMCHIHISKWSGSITESALLGKRTIIIDEFGVNSFPEVIKNGSAVPLVNKSSKDLLDLIEA